MTTKTYVSDTITTDVIKTLKYGKNYLIGSEMGSGKNYWVRNVLLPFADKLSKKTLILSHRTATRDQQDYYLKDYEYNQMRKFRGGLFQNLTYQQFENRIEKKDFTFINQFDFIVCDEAHYFTNDCNMNLKTEICFDWLNENTTAMKFFLTGTYESFKYLPWNSLIQLKEADYLNSNVENLWGYKDINQILPRIEERIINGEKVLCIFESISEGKEFMLSTGIKTALLTSGNKENNNEYTSVVYNQTLNSDILVSTSLLSEGVEIKDEVTKTIILDGITEIEKFVQSSARIRENKINVYYKIPSKSKLQRRLRKFIELDKLITEFEELGEIDYIKSHGIETIKKSHKFLYPSIVIDPISGQEYTRLKLHECNVANIRFQLDMYMEMYEKGFENVIQRYFPNAVIYNYDELIKQNLIENKILDNFIGKKLFKDEQQELKNILIREYNLRKSLGINKINEEFKNKNIAFKLDSKRVKKNNKLHTVWILDKLDR